MATFTPIVEPELFDTAEEPGGAQSDPQSWARYESTPFVIEEACRALGVTKHHLARLLGLAYNSYKIYLWCSPTRRVRMSQKYALRLTMLMTKATQGYNFAGMSEIDWTTGDGKLQETNGTKDRRIPKAVRRSFHSGEGAARE